MWIALLTLASGTHLHYAQGNPLPEGKENNCLDREELQGRVIRPQKLLGGRVEEEESKEGDRDADVVDEGGVEVTFSHIPPALMIFSPSLKNDDNYAEDRLEEAELESPLLAKPGTFQS